MHAISTVGDYYTHAVWDGGADVYTIHHIINMILWASPAPPMQADSPAEFHPQGQRLWDKGVNVEAVIVKP